MKLLSWNLNHRANDRRIPPWLVGEIDRYGADALVLTEYVEGREHGAFIARLRTIGYQHISVSPLTKGQNQVLVATQGQHRKGRLRPRVKIAPSVPSNAQHVILTDTDMHLLGFRMPAFPRRDESLKRATWNWIHGVGKTLGDYPAVIVGDMNTQSGDSARHCGDCIDVMRTLGWSAVIPETGYSWRHRTGAGRRIDFAFVSPQLSARAAVYSWDFVANNQLSSLKVGIPDHAQLRIELND